MKNRDLATSSESQHLGGGARHDALSVQADMLRSHKSTAAYRADIDGLRALAVIAVVAFHEFPTKLPGGFNGVAIFFVISGYLMT